MYSSLSQYIHTSLASFSDTISTKTPQPPRALLRCARGVSRHHFAGGIHQCLRTQQVGLESSIPPMDENSVGMDMDGVLGLLGLLG
jgi:hypothetical protein